MSDLSFLASAPVSAFEVWSDVIEHNIHSTPIPSAKYFTPSQIEKIQACLRFLVQCPSEKREGYLANELKCPDSSKVAKLIQAYYEFLTEKSPDHTLHDFDWTASLVLGSNQLSNLKEPICTFSFEFDSTDPLKNEPETRNVEFTLDEAQRFLEQLEAARQSQRSLLSK